MKNETLVNAGAEVTVEPQNTEGAAQTVDVATDTPSKEQPQSREENAAFAAMRRQYEQTIHEREGRLSKLDSVAKAAGYGNIEDMLETQQAEEAGLSLEEWRATQQRDADQKRNAILDSEEYRQLKAQFDELHGKVEADEISRRIAEDLSKVQSVFPDVKSLEELGPVYTASISAGIDPVNAARAAKATQIKPPENIGAAGASTPPSSEYYSREDIDYFENHPELMAKMSDAEFAKLRKSLSKY